ncbi:MAG TPA: EAL domain-containing protein, partial [Clostridium sp.]
AEGVEDLEQVEYLKDILCDIVQGYYFSKPGNFDSVKTLLGKKI